MRNLPAAEVRALPPLAQRSLEWVPGWMRALISTPATGFPCSSTTTPAAVNAGSRASVGARRSPALTAQLEYLSKKPAAAALIESSRPGTADSLYTPSAPVLRNVPRSLVQTRAPATGRPDRVETT